VTVAAAAFMCLPLSSCERTWNLTIVADDHDRPTLCFARRGRCGEPGVQFNLVAVDEVDAHNHRLSQAWTIEGRSAHDRDYVLQRVGYGVVPNGWSQSAPAAPLGVGRHYSVNGEYFITRRPDGSCEVLSRGAFISRSHTP